MKILVCISHVPDTTSKIQFTGDGTTLDTNGLQFVINPHDEYGLTRALQLKEAHGGQVTAITVGDASVEPTLRKALAIGADDAVRLDHVPTSGWSAAHALSAHIRSASYDWVVCGQESIDYNGGQVPGMLAALLDWPFVNGCIGAEINGAEGIFVREIDGGKERVKASAPAVIAGKKGLVEESALRIPNMRGIMAARTKTLTVQPVSMEPSRISSVRFEKPVGRTSVRLIDKDNMGELVRLLHEEAKVI